MQPLWEKYLHIGTPAAKNRYRMDQLGMTPEASTVDP
jgi:hypothetical protein